ncbi:MAG TPA: DUF3572 domain-containing protein [Paracoccaceae bacterium]|nr:DUF3572 domain-containing protein [Paracoccaceae bacterium]HMO72042.1 DUF3572 domain-containing protein [Paracoccaceae bacterium]
MADRQEIAETLALGALGWLADDADRAGAFLAETGTAPGQLAALASDPAFLGAVLDHVLAEDDRVLALAAHLGLPPERIAAARAGLPGGDAPNWT